MSFKLKNLLVAFAMISFILIPMAGSAEPVMENYLIHANDILEISVWGVENMNKSLVVRPDGRITFPLAGEVVALGKSATELASEIEKKIASYVKQPQVTVIISKFKQPNVYVLGEVQNPGPYELTDPYMMFELLAQAKLSHPGIKDHKVTVMRRGNLTDVSLDIAKSSEQNAATYKLQEGDVVYVSFAGRPRVFLYGAVEKPGEFAIPEDPADISLVLAEAGALNSSSLKHGVTIIRGTQSIETDISNLPAGFALETNDAILVHPGKSDEITITGHVANPGIYDYIRGYTLLDAIQQAGGFSSTADMDGVQIFRNYPENPVAIKAGNLYDPKGNKILAQPGDLIFVGKKKVSFGKFFADRLLPVVRDVTIIDQALK